MPPDMEQERPPIGNTPPQPGGENSFPPSVPPQAPPPFQANPLPPRVVPKPAKRSLFARILRALFILVLIPVVLVPVYWLVPPVSTLMLWRWMTFQRVERDWRPLSEISPALVRAVIAGEDGRFCLHAGVDWQEVQNVFDDADDLGDLRGASTIPMQVAKNLFLWPGRNYVRKALEIPLAYYMDFVWSKARMIEVYLNVAEWGPDGEFGAEAAARRAFGKSARNLSNGEAALLAASLPNPLIRDASRPGPQLRRAATRRQAQAALAGSAVASCVFSR